MAYPFCIPVVVPTNYKGGVGKTLSSRVLTQGIASFSAMNGGKPVLVIDLDSQGNTSRRYDLLEALPDGSMQPKPHPELVGEDVPYSSCCDLWLNLLGGSDYYAPIPYETANPLIHVVPAHEELMRQLVKVPDERVPELGAALQKWLRSEEISEKYCCVIIDTAPAKTALIDAALVAATHVYIPFIPEPQSIDGVLSIISYVVRFMQSRRNDVPLNLLGLLPNLVMKTSLHSMNLRDLGKHEVFSQYLMPVKLNRRIGYSETDDWRNTPDQVTDVEGTAIDLEARHFIKHVWREVQKTMPAAAGVN